MPLTSRETAALKALLDTAGPIGANASMRLIAASAAHVGLLLAGTAKEFPAEKIAKVAWDLGDAFLEETVDRLLPNGLK